jgi:AcrR family transcriptional regulator
MARPRRFDRADALQAATEVFWTNGYAGSSADTLVKEMGIARQSLYDTFGNKRALYLEALRAYSAGNVSALVQILRAEKSPLAAIRSVLLAPGLLSPEDRKKGCFGINAICEFGVSDPDVTGAGASGQAALDATIEHLLEEAKLKGEVRPDLSVTAARNFIGCTLAGLKVVGRAGASSEAMREVVEVAVAALRAQPAG